ncbi:MAG: slipin family protein, partial [Pseudonocardiaceae bacterium]
AEHPAALQLRLLQTVVEVAAEKNSTLVLPFPVELLRFLEHATTPETHRPTGATTTRSAPPPDMPAGAATPPELRTPNTGLLERTATNGPPADR